MVNVTNCADVNVRLGTIKLFSHLTVLKPPPAHRNCKGNKTPAASGITKDDTLHLIIIGDRNSIGQSEARVNPKQKTSISTIIGKKMEFSFTKRG